MLVHELMQQIVRSLYIRRHADGVRSMFDDGCHTGRDALVLGLTEDGGRLLREVALLQDACTHGVLDVVVDVRDAVGKPHDIALEGIGDLIRVADDAVADGKRQVQSCAVPLDAVHHPHALLVVPVAVGADGIQDGFTGMSERRMP